MVIAPTLNPVWRPLQLVKVTSYLPHIPVQRRDSATASAYHASLAPSQGRPMPYISLVFDRILGLLART